jgi:hypothetical protein
MCPCVSVQENGKREKGKEKRENDATELILTSVASAV